jgi:hypothetical protein
MSAQVYPLPAPAKVAVLFPLLIGLAIPIALLVAIAYASPANPDLPRASAAVAVLPVVALVLAWSMHHRQVELRDGVLQVRRWPWPRRAPVDAFDLSGARIVDLDAEPALRPRLKIAGARLPGFTSGLFWLKDRRRAYVLMTSRRHVLVLPHRDGSVWLLGVERADALLAALRAR